MSATMVESEVEAVPPVVSSIQDIPLETIRESKTNPRTQFDQSKLAVSRRQYQTSRRTPTDSRASAAWRSTGHVRACSGSAALPRFEAGAPREHPRDRARTD